MLHLRTMMDAETASAELTGAAEGRSLAVCATCLTAGGMRPVRVTEKAGGLFPARTIEVDADTLARMAGFLRDPASDVARIAGPGRLAVSCLREEGFVRFEDALDPERSVVVLDAEAPHFAQAMSLTLWNLPRAERPRAEA